MTQKNQFSPHLGLRYDTWHLVRLSKTPLCGIWFFTAVRGIGKNGQDFLLHHLCVWSPLNVSFYGPTRSQFTFFQQNAKIFSDKNHLRRGVIRTFLTQFRYLAGVWPPSGSIVLLLFMYQNVTINVYSCYIACNNSLLKPCRPWVFWASGLHVLGNRLLLSWGQQGDRHRL